MNSTLNTMPFLNADDHILHQDSLALDASPTTYWTDMSAHQDSNHQALLDASYIDPETVMHASEALMRLSEQDLNIEPTLRGLNVDDAGIDYSLSPELGYSHPQTSGPSGMDTDVLSQQQPSLPPREPWDAAKVRAWREQFGLAKVHASRWAGNGGLSGIRRTETSSGVRKGNSISKAGPSSTVGIARRPSSKIGQ